MFNVSFVHSSYRDCGMAFCMVFFIAMWRLVTGQINKQICIYTLIWTAHIHLLPLTMNRSLHTSGICFVEN